MTGNPLASNTLTRFFETRKPGRGRTMRTKEHGPRPTCPTCRSGAARFAKFQGCRCCMAAGAKVWPVVAARSFRPGGRPTPGVARGSVYAGSPDLADLILNMRFIYKLCISAAACPCIFSPRSEFEIWSAKVGRLLITRGCSRDRLLLEVKPMLVRSPVPIQIAPRAAQLRLSSRAPRRTRTDTERANRLNRARVARCYKRQHPPKKAIRCCTVEYDGAIIDKLVTLRLLDDGASSDTKAVAEAVQELLALIDSSWSIL
jgi:hypothetical protein